jgi:hypothetical protein
MSVYHHSVIIVNVSVTVEIARSHEFLHLSYELGPRILYSVDGVLVDGRVTDALEELDTLLAFHLLQVPVLLDEVLLHHTHILTLLFIDSLGYKDIFGVCTP